MDESNQVAEADVVIELTQLRDHCRVSTVGEIVAVHHDLLIGFTRAIRAIEDAHAELAKYRAHPLWNIRAVEDPEFVMWPDDG